MKHLRSAASLKVYNNCIFRSIDLSTDGRIASHDVASFKADNDYIYNAIDHDLEGCIALHVAVIAQTIKDLSSTNKSISERARYIIFHDRIYSADILGLAPDEIRWLANKYLSGFQHTKEEKKRKPSKSPLAVDTILSIYKAEGSTVKIGRRFNVAQSTVFNIKNKKPYYKKILMEAGIA